MDRLTEEWRPIPETKGRYEVSSLGKVRLVQTTLSDVPFPPLATHRRHSGRGPFVLLRREKGNPSPVGLARLVGAMFLDFPRKRGVVDWLDGDDTNNAVANLVWAARHEDLPPHLRGCANNEDKHNGAEWLPVVGYEGIYEVSSLGGVRRIIRGPRNQTVRTMRNKPGRDGYVTVTLTKDGKSATHGVHRLVARAFLDLPHGIELAELKVDHINDPKSDNRVTNLRWGTHGDNMRHAVDEARDRKKRGEPTRTKKFVFPPVPDDAEWRPLTSFGIGGRFEVSNYGHVRRRLSAGPSWAGRMMTGRTLPSGYVKLSLRVPGKKNGVTKGVHLLVAAAFLPPPRADQDRIHHKNHDKADNRANNLEWVTHQQNIDCAVKAGRFVRNGKHVAAKLSLADVAELRRTAHQRTRQQHAEEFGVHPSTIDDAISGKSHAGVAIKASGKPISSVRKGDSHPRSKLTAAQVSEIARRCSEGEVAEEIAADYSVTTINIRKIMQGETWSHVTGIQRKTIRAREDSWLAGIVACEGWCVLNHSLVNVKVEDQIEGFPIGWWIDRRRQDRLNGKLSKARESRLEGMGIVWSPHDAKTEQGLAAARCWAKKKGDLADVPIAAVIDGFELGKWLGIQRTARNDVIRKGKKPNSRQARRFAELTTLGINWHPKRGPKSAALQGSK